VLGGPLGFLCHWTWEVGLQREEGIAHSPTCQWPSGWGPQTPDLGSGGGLPGMNLSFLGPLGLPLAIALSPESCLPLSCSRRGHAAARGSVQGTATESSGEGP
jgi:hypothetical protein